jgi:hypothetical protein
VKANYAVTNFDSAFKPIDVASGIAIDQEKLLMLRTQYMF